MNGVRRRESRAEVPVARRFTVADFPKIYERLRADVRRLREAPETLRATAVVNELYVLLRDRAPPDRVWNDADHFVAVSIIAIRFLWRDHLRSRARHHPAERARAGDDDGLPIALLRADAWNGLIDAPDDIALVHELLERFRRSDVPRRGRVERAVVLHHLVGLTLPETGRVLGVSQETVKKDVALFRDWATRALSPKRRALEAALDELARDPNVAHGRALADVARRVLVADAPIADAALAAGISLERAERAIAFVQAWLCARARRPADVPGDPG
jgi:DNA-directed RNA polymerase specialized sigma24 family protein